MSCTLAENVGSSGCSKCTDEYARLRLQSALLQRIYDVTAERNSHGEPTMGEDFKGVVEFLLDIEGEMRTALGVKK